MISTVQAQPACKVLDADISTNYTGECVNGLAEGKGEAAGKDQYTGQFKAGMKHGNGRYRWANGGAYEGFWESDLMHGFGRFEFANGSRFEGNYFNNKKKGQGTLSLVKGDKGLNSWASTGKWVGDLFIVSGEFDGNKLIRNTAHNSASQSGGQNASLGSCTDNNDGTFTARDGSLWQKCAFGSTFQNGTCVGSAVAVKWTDAITAAKTDRFLGHSDWIVPSFDLYKNNFFDGKCDIRGAAIQPTDDIDRQFRLKGVRGDFWTTEMGQNPDTAVVATRGIGGYDVTSIFNNSLKGAIRYRDINVVFVRNVTSQDAIAFASAQTKVIADTNRRQNEEAEYNAKREVEERQLRNAINNKNPQTMYLAAGIYERNGDSYKAKQVYEAIISRFPSSSWAVKANDQLNDTKRSNDAESAASQRQYDAQRASREADSRSKSQCSVRISQCENTCSGMKGDSWRRCNSGCQSLCSQF
jgi:predicted  nucleic acid-binding Zn-ribbon protein